MIHKRSNDTGFTFIEILIAITVLTVALLGAAGLTISIIRSNSNSEKITTATILAQQQMERIKKLGYPGAETAAGTEDYGTVPNNGSFKRVTSVVADTYPNINYKTITVSIYWKNASIDFKERNVRLQTIIAE